MGDANHGGTRLTGVTGTERVELAAVLASPDRKSTRLNSSHLVISYAVFCLKKKKRLPARLGVECPIIFVGRGFRVTAETRAPQGGIGGNTDLEWGWRPWRLFFFNDTATTEIYTLSLHDALPI